MKPLSATMVSAIDAAIEAGGQLVRYQGGFWVAPGTPWNGSRPGSEYFATPTIHACVVRGELEYSEWKEGRNGRFPIAARVKASA